MSEITELLKSDNSYYKHTKQTVLLALYKVLIACLVFFSVILTIYVVSDSSKSQLIEFFLYLIVTAIGVIVLLIISIYVYYVFIKKDTTPLQSEDLQIAKELLTKMQGDSLTGMIVVEGIKSLTQRNGETQTGKQS